MTPEAALFIGKRHQGHVSNYYLGDPVTDEEVAAIQAVAEKLDISILNTRSVSFKSAPTLKSHTTLSFSVRKTGSKFILLVASSKSQPSVEHDILGGKAKLTVQYGDMQEELNKATIALREVM